MSSLVVIQARTTSKRLPAKALLPIKGLPLVILAAKRAENLGRLVIVATSTDYSDDGLVSVLQEYGVNYYRGSLDDPLERIVNTLEKFKEEDIVFRLTADNVFPDGILLNELEKDFVDRNLKYLCCSNVHSGLPYGMSVEVMHVGSLREANNMAKNLYDREHVTPYIKRKYGEEFFIKYAHLHKGHFRCTVDTLDDYLNVQQLFQLFRDPVLVPSIELVSKIDIFRYAPIENQEVSKFVLGTAQLGMKYGIANCTGQPSKSQSIELIKNAISNGVEYIETAQVYGQSEEIVGQALQCGWRERVKVITKLSLLEKCPHNAEEETVNAFVDASIYRSCMSLQVKSFDVLMLHRADHLHQWNGRVLKRLIALKSLSLFDDLGVSVQSPKELEMALAVPDISYIQMPINLLDWRWDAFVSKINSIKKTRKLVIHARSVFLQGLLLTIDEQLWQKANVQECGQIHQWMKQQVACCNKTNIADLCLSYINSLQWVDGLSIGVETMKQLLENISLFAKPPLADADMLRLCKSRPKLSTDSLDPSCWRKEDSLA